MLSAEIRAVPEMVSGFRKSIDRIPNQSILEA
jgi:hypothetical protein